MARRRALRHFASATLSLLLVVTLAAPLAQAHVEPHPHILQRVEGGLVFSALLDTDLLLEREEVDLRVHVVRFDTGEHPDPLRLEAHVARADGAAPAAEERVALEPTDEPGHFLARVLFPDAGEYVLRLRALDANVSVELPFPVYPQPGHRFGWADLRAPFATADEPLRLAFRVVDADGRLVEEPPSGELVIERWTTDGEWRLGTQRVPLAPTGEPGMLSTPDVTLREGHHLLFVGIEDLGLPPGARPPIPLYAHAPDPEAADATADTSAAGTLQDAPGGTATPGIPPSVLLLGLAALALRRRRGS